MDTQHREYISHSDASERPEKQNFCCHKKILRNSTILSSDNSLHPVTLSRPLYRTELVQLHPCHILHFLKCKICSLLKHEKTFLNFSTQLFKDLSVQHFLPAIFSMYDFFFLRILCTVCQSICHAVCF